ncbi:hypothetical protein RhiirA1_534634 [Rhizophagus irregularis]|uniref:DUF8211 domain-containing protein n=1 Tax=Rhizophagus irregularis TaxID=588596 RepID=A0A2I1DXI2_9GLOM|nr:hypothetical protein RhiirA1_534634 [Rhizophagus irregularis]PKY14575.1 hypothetical protein RhiirB3_426593 [Rhizophagus irregularis]
MSNNRRACITHQHDFFKVLSILIQPLADNTLPKRDRHKVLHANRCFDLWKKKESKTIFSHRLDIKYQMDYKANGFKYTLIKPEDLPYVPQSLYSQNLAKLIILLVVTNGEEPFKLKRKDAESKRKQAAMNVFHQRAKPPRYDKIKSKTVLMNDAMTNIFNVSGLDTSKQIFWRHTCCCLYDDTKEIERRPNKRDVLTSFQLSCYERKIQTKNSTNH